MCRPLSNADAARRGAARRCCPTPITGYERPCGAPASRRLSPVTCSLANVPAGSRAHGQADGMLEWDWDGLGHLVTCPAVGGTGAAAGSQSRGPRLSDWREGTGEERGAFPVTGRYRGSTLELLRHLRRQFREKCAESSPAPARAAMTSAA